MFLRMGCGDPPLSKTNTFDVCVFVVSDIFLLFWLAQQLSIICLSPNGETNVVQHLSTNDNILNCQAGEERNELYRKKPMLEKGAGSFIKETDVR